ncbi:unnamed protein product [Pedinophyceae sp. YPF-701]|nr:unnamed protein product [Pedinophyceae sp. YPF-701]
MPCAVPVRAPPLRHGRLCARKGRDVACFGKKGQRNRGGKRRSKGGLGKGKLRTDGPTDRERLAGYVDFGRAMGEQPSRTREQLEANLQGDVLGTLKEDEFMREFADEDERDLYSDFDALLQGQDYAQSGLRRSKQLERNQNIGSGPREAVQASLDAARMRREARPLTAEDFSRKRQQLLTKNRNRKDIFGDRGGRSEEEAAAEEAAAAEAALQRPRRPGETAGQPEDSVLSALYEAGGAREEDVGEEVADFTGRNFAYSPASNETAPERVAELYADFNGLISGEGRDKKRGRDIRRSAANKARGPAPPGAPPPTPGAPVETAEGRVVMRAVQPGVPKLRAKPKAPRTEEVAAPKAPRKAAAGGEPAKRTAGTRQQRQEGAGASGGGRKASAGRSEAGRGAREAGQRRKGPREEPVRSEKKGGGVAAQGGEGRAEEARGQDAGVQARSESAPARAGRREAPREESQPAQAQGGGIMGAIKRLFGWK